MKTTHTIIIIILLILAFALGLFFNKLFLTGSAIQEPQKTETLTKALCVKNQCIDVLITSQNGEITKIKPISDIVEFPENWQDPRE